MESYFLNGGMIGVTLDFESTERYVIGETTGLAELSYVGGRTQTSTGGTANLSVSLTALTGGTDTAPQEGDLVIIAMCIASTANRAYRISGYDVIADLYANDTFDSNFQVGYKIMGSTPDTTATITGGSGSTADGLALAVYVWRNVDLTTPFDVTSVLNGPVIDTGLVNPPAITPVTSGAIIIAAGGTAHNGGTDTFGASYLSNFLTAGANSTNDATIGIGHVAWTSGAYDPAAWTFSQTNSNTFSTNSVTFALRPATVLVPILGNLKNSGIWNLSAIFEALYEIIAPPGQSAYTTAGTFSFEVPSGITEISAVVIGGGGGGGGSEDNDETGGGVRRGL
jgi:hypothetical protein